MEQGSGSDTKDSKYSRFHMFSVCRNNKSENMWISAKIIKFLVKIDSLFGKIMFYGNIKLFICVQLNPNRKNSSNVVFFTFW